MEPNKHPELVPDTTGRDVVTVILVDNPNGQEKNMRCMNCGYLVFTYRNGKVSTLFVGKLDYPHKTADHMCGRCHLIYRVG